MVQDIQNEKCHVNHSLADCNTAKDYAQSWSLIISTKYRCTMQHSVDRAANSIQME